MALGLLVEFSEAHVSARLLQFSPQANAPAVGTRANTEFPSGLSGSPIDLGIVRSWFETDCDFSDASENRINWGGIFGLALAVSFSVAFWTGVAFIAERLWK